MKIVEATEVNIYRCGMDNALREVAGVSYKGSTFAFYIADPNKPVPSDNYGFATEIEFFDCAYIENAHGATTERVHAY